MRGNVFLILGLLGLLAFVTAGAIGYGAFVQESLRVHVLVGLGACVLLVFSQGWIVIYVLALARTIKDWQRRQGADADLARQASRWVRRIVPAGSFAVLAGVGSYLLGGATLTRFLPSWPHHAEFFVAVMAQAWALSEERRVLAASDRLVRTAERQQASHAI